MNQDATPETAGGAKSGLAPNAAAALAYVPAPVTGVIMYFIESDPFVRFHAWQSMLFGVAWYALWQVLTALIGLVALVPFLGWLAALLGGTLISLVVGLGGFVIWLLLVVRAYGGASWQLPVVGPLAARFAAEDGPNARSVVAYVLGPISGFVLLQRDRDPLVRFHAWQSIMLFLGLIAASIAFNIILIPASGIVWMVLEAARILILNLGFVYFFLTAIAKAGEGERYKLPVIGDLAEQYASK
ncbi:MAG: DUF4870 domain-containing protein [Chloroflexota bacterium]